MLPGQLPPGIRAVIVVKEGKNNDRRSDVPEVADKQTEKLTVTRKTTSAHVSLKNTK